MKNKKRKFAKQRQARKRQPKQRAYLTINEGIEKHAGSPELADAYNRLLTFYLWIEQKLGKPARHKGFFKQCKYFIYKGLFDEKTYAEAKMYLYQAEQVMQGKQN